MICDVHCIDPAYPQQKELFDLLHAVYSSSDYLSENFHDKYPSPAALSDEIANTTQRPGALFLVAKEEQWHCGYLLIKPRHQSKLRHTADLHMGIHPEARGQGLGQRLLRTALARLEADAVLEIVYLMVRADNLPAIALYTNMGFEHVATLPQDTKIDDKYFDGVLMRTRIQTPNHSPV